MIVSEMDTVRDIVEVDEFETLAADRMSRMVHAYVSGAAADGFTLRDNRQAWSNIRLAPRVLSDVSQICLKTEIVGHEFQMPILLAPVGLQRMCHPDGELATVAGANRAGAGFVLSTLSNVALEEVVAAAESPVWFQLYVQKDHGVTRRMIERAQHAGCKALCVTVDAPVLGARYNEIRAQFRAPSTLPLPNLDLECMHHAALGNDIYSDLLNPRLQWKDVEDICMFAKLPVLLKGILNPDDATRALDTGVAGLIVSNHGARNLDTLPSTAEALPLVLEKVKGKLPVLVDGGVRRGTDVLKALALGAKAVLIGRPYVFALASAGAPGVARVLEILRAELRMAMALTGRASIAAIDRSVLWRSLPGR